MVRTIGVVAVAGAGLLGFWIGYRWDVARSDAQEMAAQPTLKAQEDAKAATEAA